MFYYKRSNCFCFIFSPCPHRFTPMPPVLVILLLYYFICELLAFYIMHDDTSFAQQKIYIISLHSYILFNTKHFKCSRRKKSRLLLLLLLLYFTSFASFLYIVFFIFLFCWKYTKMMWNTATNNCVMTLKWNVMVDTQINIRSLCLILRFFSF